MGKRKPPKTVTVKPIQNINTMFLMTEYQMMLEKEPEYSLQVDPTDKYHMSDSQKEFIAAYVQYKSIPLAASLTHIEPDKAAEMFALYSTQQEIRRIGRAMYARQFSSKMLSVDQIGGWLSSLLTDENVPYADRLKTSEKLKVAEMILKLNEYQKNSIVDPSIIVVKDIESQVKDLSLETIRQLISADDSLQEKRKLIKELDVDGTLTPEDISYLETLTYDELLKLIDTINQRKGE